MYKLTISVSLKYTADFNEKQGFILQIGWVSGSSRVVESIISFPKRFPAKVFKKVQIPAYTLSAIHSFVAELTLLRLNENEEWNLKKLYEYFFKEEQMSKHSEKLLMHPTGHFFLRAKAQSLIGMPWRPMQLFCV